MLMQRFGRPELLELAELVDHSVSHELDQAEWKLRQLGHLTERIEVFGCLHACTTV
jgi:hypothetical protein